MVIVRNLHIKLVKCMLTSVLHRCDI